MVIPSRPQPAKRGSMRPPPRPNPLVSASARPESPADSIPSGSMSRCQSPSALQSAGMKRKERDFDQDAGEETNINVVVRCRGRSSREVKENSGVVVSVNGLKSREVELSMGPNALSNKSYHFDKVFSPAADQAIIFDDVVKPFLSEMLTGYNCTIFAYGQTGTGKTYTMSGDMEDTMGLLSDAAGIIPRVLHTLFQKLEADQVECSVKCSFIELYNEALRDLLAADDGTKLKIYDDNNKKGHGATMVQGMEESHIKSASAGIKLLQMGSHKRQVAATKCNDLSSRSHTVFTITTYIKKVGETEEDFVCAGKLNLVDLAGSENIQRSGAENKRAAEAGLINKSLLTLGRVINALVDRSSHIPYRESKLTRLLQDSLGGRTKTCIIANVSPAKSNLEETISTLDYAFRAKNIRNKPQVNSMISKKTLLKEFTAEIEKLKSELISTRQRNGVYLSNEQFEEITVESESRRILAEEQGARIETLEISLRNKVQDLFSLTNTFNGLKRDNEATRLALENTNDVLAKTEIVLRDTELLLSEEREMRKAYQETESQLYGLGTGLITKLDETVQDLGGLHSKLRRKSDLHLLNRQKWEFSAAQLAEVTKAVDAKVEKFQDEQSTTLTTLRARMEQFLGSEVEKINLDKALLTSHNLQYEKVEKQVREQTSISHDEMNQVLEEIKVLREEVKGRVGDGLHGLSAAAARISGEVILEMEEFHTQLHLSFSALGRDFKSIFEDVVRHATSQREEVEELRKQLVDANEKIMAASTGASSSLERCLSDERDAAQHDREHLLSQVKALVDESARKQESRMNSSIDGTRSQLVSSRSDFERAGKVYAEGMSQWSDKERSFMGEVVKSRDSLKNKMKNDWTDVSSRNTTIQTTTKAVHSETVRIVDTQLQDMAVQMAALDESVTRAREQNGRHHSSQHENLDKLSTNVREALSHVDNTLESNSSRIQDHMTTSTSDLASVQNGLPPLSRTIREPIAGLQAYFESNQPVEYIPTGQTPRKRDWTYPARLPRPADQDTLLARLRGLPDPTTTSNAPPIRSPRKIISPRKLTSPRKALSSPTKLPSPTKTRIFVDAVTAEPPRQPPVPLSPSTTRPASSSEESKTAAAAGGGGSTSGGGLREVDLNVLAQVQAHPPPLLSSSTSSSSFFKSISSKTGEPPPLKRHATTTTANSTASGAAAAAGVGENARVSRKGRENNNNNNNNNAAVGMGMGRRLRSSPQT